MRLLWLIEPLKMNFRHQFTLAKVSRLPLLVVLMSIANTFLRPGFQSLLADYTPRERRGKVTSAVGGGNFFVDIRGTGYGGGMLLFIPAAVAQTLGGVLYEANPTIPFMVMSAGMVVVIV